VNSYGVGVHPPKYLEMMRKYLTRRKQILQSPVRVHEKRKIAHSKYVEVKMGHQTPSLIESIHLSNPDVPGVKMEIADVLHCFMTVRII
jgi:hypothetical protein